MAKAKRKVKATKAKSKKTKKKNAATRAKPWRKQKFTVSHHREFGVEHHPALGPNSTEERPRKHVGKSSRRDAFR